MNCQLDLVPLELVERGVLDCRRCDLRGEDAPVPGAGGPARVMVVGEAPRGDDALLGRPFEDRAGLNLKKLMRMAGLKHEECYLTFAAKCVGGPTREWKAMKGPCRTWLWQELRAVRPRVVVALGWNPARLLLKPGSKARLEDVAGAFHPLPYLPGAWCLAWHSPAVVLRHGRAMELRTVKLFNEARELACSGS